VLAGFHLRVTRIVLETLEPLGFALGGGYALQVHGVTDRPSDDLDNYAASLDPAVYDAAEAALVQATADAGLTTTVLLSDSWFREIEIRDPQTGSMVPVDLGYDYRTLPPIKIADLGPVLSLEDVIVGKTRALADRQAPRDFYDIDAILSSGRANTDGLREILATIRPELPPSTLFDLLKSARSQDTSNFARLGMSHNDAEALFDRLEGFAESSTDN
jgi:hypothetical protein